MWLHGDGWLVFALFSFALALEVSNLHPCRVFLCFLIPPRLVDCSVPYVVYFVPSRRAARGNRYGHIP